MNHLIGCEEVIIALRAGVELPEHILESERVPEATNHSLLPRESSTDIDTTPPASAQRHRKSDENYRMTRDSYL